jgi:DNA-binding IscR family transcriptional regulator
MNSRFAVAVHILTLLDENEGAPLTSEMIAGSVNTNPTVVRRMLGALSASGLTLSQLGNGGGARLAKPAEKITLLEVYRASGEGSSLFGLHDKPNPKCLVGRNLQAALTGHLDEATAALEASLSKTTIAGMLRDVKREETRRLRKRA